MVESDDQPYFTERPAWPGYCALLTWTAHAEHPDLPIPAAVPDSWLNDQAYQRSTQPDFPTSYRTILEPQLWLPADFPFIFAAPTLASESNTPIGSVFTLQRQLEQLQARTAMGLAAESEMAQTAASALSMFRTLAERACHYRLPLLLSF